jgi:hypothetical protein
MSNLKSGKVETSLVIKEPLPGKMYVYVCVCC